MSFLSYSTQKPEFISQLSKTRYLFNSSILLFLVEQKKNDYSAIHLSSLVSLEFFLFSVMSSISIFIQQEVLDLNLGQNRKEYVFHVPKFAVDKNWKS